MPTKQAEVTTSFLSIPGGGSIASTLLANDMNPASLRTNDTLQYREWAILDTTVYQEALLRLRLIKDLRAAGMVYPLNDALGTTILNWQNVSMMEDAQVSMTANMQTLGDRVDYDFNSMPVPIVHTGFDIDVRTLRASRRLGETLDTTQARIATRKVAEKLENMAITSGTFKYGGATLYGLTNYTYTNSVTLSTAWDASGKTAAEILDDVQNMLKAERADHFYGPFMLYVPAAWEGILDQDYVTTTASVTTIRERIRMIDAIQDVRVMDYLTANTALLIQMTPDVCQVVDGIQPMLIQWPSSDGMMFHFKVIAIMPLRMQSDYEGRCGVCKLAA